MARFIVIVIIAAAILAMANAQCTADCKVDQLPKDPNTNAPADIMGVRGGSIYRCLASID